MGLPCIGFWSIRQSDFCETPSLGTNWACQVLEHFEEIAAFFGEIYQNSLRANGETIVPVHAGRDKICSTKLSAGAGKETSIIGEDNFDELCF